MTFTLEKRLMNRQLTSMATRAIFTLALIVTLCPRVLSEEKPMVPVKEGMPESAVRLSGNLRVDLFGFERLPSQEKPAVQQDVTKTGSRKSPWIAAGLSLVLPGSGEFYAESYWKSAVFLAVEIAAWALAYTFDKKGDDQTDSFQSYANQHWIVNQYAQWTLDNATTINPTVDVAPYKDPVTGVIVNGVVNWTRLNQLESALGNWYSHNLPPYGEQQYYELIGKYPQFNQGWDDANLALPGEYDVIKANLTPNYQYYSGERGEANEYYDKASTFVTVAIVNHIVSALDAAWSAGTYNKVHAEVRMQAIPAGGYYAHVPVLKVRYGF